MNVCIILFSLSLSLVFFLSHTHITHSFFMYLLDMCAGYIIYIVYECVDEDCPRFRRFFLFFFARSLVLSLCSNLPHICTRYIQKIYFNFWNKQHLHKALSQTGFCLSISGFLVAFVFAFNNIHTAYMQTEKKTRYFFYIPMDGLIQI